MDMSRNSEKKAISAGRDECGIRMEFESVRNSLYTWMKSSNDKIMEKASTKHKL